ncbi:hypothetical protein BP6252_03592 [Coleophoma cylindrospora]|uniref:Thioester reductase (TE) domain-containing protein n=1 Tax=Coleophoma cylindrospora TaxID=1849047 RepID=A0A3D8S8D9_9HELO|nr:hypothetical protein BP6252_03592 [Coleophoma cylindrospora]
MDSLQTIELVNTLTAGLELYRRDSDLSWLTIRTVYSRPSLDALAKAITANLSKKLQLDHTNDRISQIESMIQKYTTDLHDLPPVNKTTMSKLHVLLTGTTGSLGTHLLEALMLDPKVQKVTCFNRSPSARQQHVEHFRQRGLTFRVTQIPAVKIVDFFQGLATAMLSDALTYKTEKSQKYSRTMAALSPVKTEWMNIWLKQWQF